MHNISVHQLPQYYQMTADTFHHLNYFGHVSKNLFRYYCQKGNLRFQWQQATNQTLRKNKIVRMGSTSSCSILTGMSLEKSIKISKKHILKEKIHHHHHHHVALVAQISLTLSRHSSLSFIALGRSSGQHPVSSHSCWMYVRAGRPAFARPCVGANKSTSLMSSSLLLQQCPACLVRLT